MTAGSTRDWFPWWRDESAIVSSSCLPSLPLHHHHPHPHHCPRSSHRISIPIEHHSLPSLLFYRLATHSLLATMRGFLGLSVLPLLAYTSPILVDTIHNEAAPILSSVNAK